MSASSAAAPRALGRVGVEVVAARRGLVELHRLLDVLVHAVTSGRARRQGPARRDGRTLPTRLTLHNTYNLAAAVQQPLFERACKRTVLVAHAEIKHGVDIASARSFFPYLGLLSPSPVDALDREWECPIRT